MTLNLGHFRDGTPDQEQFDRVTLNLGQFGDMTLAQEQFDLATLNLGQFSIQIPDQEHRRQGALQKKSLFISSSNL